jgi:hypothetical protein
MCLLVKPQQRNLLSGVHFTIRVIHDLPSIYPWIAFTEMVITADRLTSVQLNFFLNSAKNRLSAYPLPVFTSDDDAEVGW